VAIGAELGKRQISPSKITLVLADDHPLVLSALEAVVARDPLWQLAGAYLDGVSALEGIRRVKPDVAVLDIQMPGMSGLEILHAVVREGLRTRIVFLTGSATGREIAEALEIGAWGIVLKAEATSSILHCLREVVAGRHCALPEALTVASRRPRGEGTESKGSEPRITAREKEILALVADGNSNREIARSLGLSEGTVKIHLNNMFRKLGVGNRTELAALAFRSGRGERDV
jgi:two-component system, NarL family, nitrate/nitrite response regulator NarL